MIVDRSAFHFRKASMADLEILRHWDTKEHIRVAIPNDNWDWEKELDESPAWREQFIAMVDDIPIGFLQIIDPHLEETHYWGEMEPNKRAIDIWIGEEDYLNKGFGTLIMKEALRRCFSQIEINEVLVDPAEENVNAIRFYERLGFSYKEHRLFEGDKGPVYSI
ncbi:MAG: GNAT family N-acetyltransferase, partial [Flavobacteriales bacterium]|nr:GNAT family N-acetyltransferase [Flavobacteriales bacterium]